MVRQEEQREEAMESRGCSVPLSPAPELRTRKGSASQRLGPLAVLALLPLSRRRFLSGNLPTVCVHVQHTLNCMTWCDGHRAE